MTTLNLDVFAEDDNIIVLDGEDYLVPSSVPTWLMLRFMNARKDSDDNMDSIEEGLKVFHEIFKLRQPELEFEEFAKHVTLDMYAAITNFLFSGISVEDTKELLDEAKEERKDTKKKPLQAIS